MQLKAEITIDLSPLRALQKGTGVILRRAMERGTKAMTKKAKDLAPRLADTSSPLIPGLLKKAYGRVSRTYRKGSVVVVLIGARRGFGQVVGHTKDGKAIKQDPAKYDHFSELGTVREAAQPHLRPAFDTEKGAARATINQEIIDGVEKALAKG